MLPARPRITLLAPRKILVGEPATLTVRLDVARETTIAFVDLAVHTWKSHQGMRIDVMQLGARLRSEGRLPAGVTELDCRVDVPIDALPSYQGNLVAVQHEARVHVSIPYWPDVRRSFQLSVRPPPRAARAWDALLFASAAGGAPATGPYAEVSLANRSLAPSDVLSGAVALYNVATSRYDKVVVSLRQRERSGGHEHVAAAWQIELAPRFVEGQPVPFSLRVPELAPTMSIGGIAVTHELVVTVRSSWAELLTMPVPIEVLPDPLGAMERGRAAPALGEERVRVLWERVGVEQGFTLERESLTRTEGPCTASVRRDLSRGASLLVAEVRHPALGLGLRSAPHGTLSFLAASGPTTGIVAIDAKLAFEARCHPQAEPFLAALGRALTPLLSGRMSIEAIDDERIALALPDSGTTEAKIRSVAVAARQLATVMQAHLPLVPLPPPLDAARAEWQGLAARLGGRLEQGSGTLRGGDDDAGFLVRPVLGEDGRALGLRIARAEHQALEVTTPTIARSEAALASLRDDVRRACAPLLERGGELSIAAHELALTVQLGAEWPAHELPERVERILAHLARLASTLRPQRGPFR